MKYYEKTQFNSYQYIVKFSMIYDNHEDKEMELLIYSLRQILDNCIFADLLKINIEKDGFDLFHYIEILDWAIDESNDFSQLKQIFDDYDYERYEDVYDIEKIINKLNK